MQVLVIDDDPDIREVVRLSLDHLAESKGFNVIEVGDANEALEIVGRIAVDVVVLDLGLPDMAGLDLLQRLHGRDREIRILVLTGEASEATRIEGLVSGADDFMVKPFSPKELAARVVALGRRRPGGPTTFTFGTIRVDCASREVSMGGEPIELTRREFDLLSFLVSNPGQTFTRDELLKGAFVSSAEWQSEATITEHMRRLRLKLEADPTEPEHLLTVRGLGYRFEPGGAEVELLPSNAGSSLDAIYVTVDDRIVFASSAALALMGYPSLDDVLGRDPLEFVAPESETAAHARRQRAGDGRWPRPEVLSVVRADGCEVVVQLWSSPVLWQGKPATQVTLWDLTDEV